MFKSRLLWQSVITIATVSIFNTIVHELGHYFMALLYGAKDIELHHNYVSYDYASVSFMQGVWIAAAGPLLSLALGIICLLIYRNLTIRNWPTLALLWLAFHALLTFLGYILIAPVFPYGDTGFIFHKLGFPIWLMIVLSVLAASATFIVFDKGGKLFQPYFENASDSNQQTAAKLFMWPIFISTVFGILINLPVPTVLSIIAPATMPFAFFTFYGGFLRNKTANRVAKIDKISWTLGVFFVVMVILFRILV